MALGVGLIVPANPEKQILYLIIRAGREQSQGPSLLVTGNRAGGGSMAAPGGGGAGASSDLGLVYPIADYLVTTADDVVAGTVAVAPMSIRLYPAANWPGKNKLSLKNQSAADEITVIPDGAETIDGETSFVLYPDESIDLFPIELTTGWFIQ